MTEHIHMDAVGLPTEDIKELAAPCLLNGEHPTYVHSEKSWLGKTSVMELYSNGVIRLSPGANQNNEVLLRAGLLSTKTTTRFMVPSVFTALSLVATIGSGAFYYFAVFNEWMFSFCLILALALLASQTVYRISFFTKGGAVELFSLTTWFIHYKNIDAVSRHIINMIPNCEFHDAGLAVQVQEHRRLFNQGQIDKPSYEAAKARLFSHKAGATASL